MKIKTNFSTKHFTKITFCIALLLCIAFNLQAKNLYVSVNNGNNNNSGTSPNVALKTLQGAMFKAQPGDIVNVMAGNYNSWNQGTNPVASLLWIDPQYSGTLGNPITYRVNPGDEGRVILQNHRGESVIHVNGADHIIIDGFKILGQAAFTTHDELQNEYYNIRNGAARTARNSGVGIMVQGENHDSFNPAVNVIVRNCDISRCTGSGIAVNKTAKVIIEGNRVYNNAKYSVLGTSGISVFQPANCNGNCFDFPNTKDNKYSIIIRGNRVFNNDNFYECDCSGYQTITDGNGIIIDQGRTVNNNEKYLIENNIVVGNGGKGIHIYKSDNVNIINNSLYKNATRGNQYGRSDISVNEADNIRIHNNITNPVNNAVKSMFINATNVNVSKNLHAKDITNVGPAINRLNNRRDFPHFNPDYTLKSTSPAINFGNSNYSVSSKDFAGNARINGASVDAGAIEFIGNPCTEKLTNSTFNTPNASNIPGWKVFKGQGATMNNSINQWGVAHLKISNGGPQKYNLQLFQDNLAIENNSNYVIKVRMRAAKNRSIRVIVRPVEFPNGEAYYYLNRTSVNLTSDFKEYTFNFNSNRAESNARLAFLVGSNNEDVFIDRVSFKKVCNNKITESKQFAKIYPNPVSNHLTVSLDENVQNADITLFDLTGRLILTQNTGSDTETSIDVSKLVAGSYFVRIQLGNAVYTQKILKH